MASQISNRELVDAYIRFRGFKRLSGEAEDLSCLVPLLLLDMERDLFKESIKPIQCRHETQRARTRWHECYDRFNNGSFLAFRDEYEDKIMELMDDLAEYIYNNVMYLRVAVMDVFKDQADTDVQKTIADIIICNTFAQMASSWWGSTFKKVSHKSKLSYEPEQNSHLKGMVKYSLEFCNGYANDIMHHKGRVELQNYPSVVKATNALDRKISEWAGRKLHEDQNGQ